MIASTCGDPNMHDLSLISYLADVTRQFKESDTSFRRHDATSILQVGAFRSVL